MAAPKQLLLVILIISSLSCRKREGSYPYAIKDFPKVLQPHLTKIVTRGIVMSMDSALRYMATDDELRRLGRSEHPILRAAAFREMLARKSFNHFDILMEHLDDTALVFTDGGEFGIIDRMVSDDILQEAVWKTRDAKNKTIEEVLTKHNYLRSAYLILLRIEPQERFYPFIKNMATRSRRLDFGGSELAFDDIEHALYGLARFRKKEDVQIIKNRLIRDAWQLSEFSFKLMKEYPDTAYMDVLEIYHRKMFYRFSGHRPGGFTGYAADRAAPEDFIDALLAQQNDRSAKLLDTILNRLPVETGMPDRVTILHDVINGIWLHPCPAYAKLRKKIEAKVDVFYKWQTNVPRIEIPTRFVDTSQEDITWYN